LSGQNEALCAKLVRLGPIMVKYAEAHGTKADVCDQSLVFAQAASMLAFQRGDHKKMRMVIRLTNGLAKTCPEPQRTQALVLGDTDSNASF